MKPHARILLQKLENPPKQRDPQSSLHMFT